MNYRSDGRTHSLTMDKDEFLTLISLLYEGLENLKEKARRDVPLAAGKYENVQVFMNEFGRMIMTGGPSKTD